MHICFITTGDIKNVATAKRALGMSVPLINAGWRVSILMEDTDENRHRVALECTPQTEVFFFKKTSAIHEIIVKNKIINKIKPDFLYVCAFVTRNAVAIGSRYKKLVEHSELQSEIPDFKGFRRLKALITEYFSIYYSDGILCASKYLQKVFEKKCIKMRFPNKPNLYFPYAYSTNLIHKVNINFNDKKWKELQGGFRFVYLGSILRNYGVFTILEAAQKLKKKGFNFKVLILGKGRHYDLAQDFIKKAEMEKYVYMPGYIKEEEISSFFSLADCFISPMNDTIQDWARCPSKLYMYLPYCKPIITCKIGEPFEVLKSNGLYYKPGDADDLCKQMEYIIKNKEKYSTLETLFQKHTWEYRTHEFTEWIKSNFINKPI